MSCFTGLESWSNSRFSGSGTGIGGAELDRNVEVGGAGPQHRPFSVAIVVELDSTQGFEFLEVPVDLAVIAVDEACCLADAFGLFVGDYPE